MHAANGWAARESAPGGRWGRGLEAAAATTRGVLRGMAGAPLRGFTLVELVIVVVILGVLAAVAIPAAGSAGRQARLRSLHADTRELQTAIERYAAEHQGLTPAHGPDGSVDGSGDEFARRLTELTDDLGQSGVGAIFGPYLREVPRNPFSGCGSVRIDGDAAAQHCSWRFDTARGTIRADHATMADDDLHHGEH